MKKILVIRNDKLGDFMLAWPALSLLKSQYPDAHITVLLPSYTKPIAKLCPWIDDIIIYERSESTLLDARNLAKTLKPYDFNISISLYSETRTAMALWLARIPQRFGPATKIAQCFLNKTLKQKRSRSLKPEHEYNTDLIRHYITTLNSNPVKTPSPPFLQFDAEATKKVRLLYIKNCRVKNDKKLIFIHAGSGGSAVNLSLSQYAELASLISQSNNVHFVLTAGPGELNTAKKLAKLISNTSHSIYHSTHGLTEFARFLNTCDLFISGSTGPLHIAGALNRPTAGFYPARRSATALRWQTLNQQDRRLSFSPQQHINEDDMQTINISDCAKGINSYLYHQK